MSIIELKVPVIGESVTEVTLSSWLKEDGAIVELDEIICEFESDKATVEVPAEKAGKLIWVAQEDDDIAIDGVFAKIDTSYAGASDDSGSSDDTPAKEEPKPEAKKEETAPAKEDSYAAGHPSPTAQKLMQENNINAADVTATGKDGRITQEDVQKAIAAKANQKAAPKQETKPAPKKEAAAPVKTVDMPPASGFSRATRTEKMSRMRRPIA